jgi:hypothetical protein
MGILSSLASAARSLTSKATLPLSRRAMYGVVQPSLIAAWRPDIRRLAKAARTSAATSSCGSAMTTSVRLFRSANQAERVDIVDDVSLSD